MLILYRTHRKIEKKSEEICFLFQPVTRADPKHPHWVKINGIKKQVFVPIVSSIAPYQITVFETV